MFKSSSHINAPYKIILQKV